MGCLLVGLGQEPSGPWLTQDRQAEVGVAAVLVGRRDELGIIEAALLGGAAPVLVTGDAGIGKTRLVARSTDCRNMWGWSWPGCCRGSRHLRTGEI
jgi:hypothetical protein